MMKLGYVDPFGGNECNSNGLAECIEKGKAAFAWDEKAAFANQTGPVRRDWHGYFSICFLRVSDLFRDIILPHSS